MTGFVALAFGLCAGLTSWGEQPTVSMGYVSHGQCIVHLTVGKPGAFTMAGHDIVIDFIEGGATIEVDGHKFVLQDGEPV